MCTATNQNDFSNVSLTLGQMGEIGRKYVYVIDYDFASREVTVTLLWNCWYKGKAYRNHHHCGEFGMRSDWRLVGRLEDGKD